MGSPGVSSLENKTSVGIWCELVKRQCCGNADFLRSTHSLGYTKLVGELHEGYAGTSSRFCNLCVSLKLFVPCSCSFPSLGHEMLHSGNKKMGIALNNKKKLMESESELT